MIPTIKAIKKGAVYYSSDGPYVYDINYHIFYDKELKKIVELFRIFYGTDLISSDHYRPKDYENVIKTDQQSFTYKKLNRFELVRFSELRRLYEDSKNDT